MAKKDHAELQDILKTENRGLYCLDEWPDDLYFIGGELSEIDYTSLDIMLLPCNYIHTQFGYVGDTIAEECIPDKDQ